MAHAKLTPAVRAFLDEKRFASLATINPDGSPHQTVMWFQLRDDHVMMNTRRNRVKDQNMVRDPRISICIEDGARYVTIAGTVAMIDDQTIAQADIKALAVRYNGQDDADAIASNTFSKQERIILSIDHVIADGFDN
jgi:PPOX class probable F420-dependent enzyme